MGKKDGLSNMMKHYLSVKEEYKDCVVFYRLGDFYEMFFDDAVEVSKVLDLTLTGRDCGLEERAPMCGVPFHAAELYIGKLVSAGYKVAICEQLSQPNGKELVTRDVVRVVTSGTVTDDSQIDEKINNYICAVCTNSKSFGISWADITTGDFKTAKADEVDKLLDLLTRIDPSEIITDKATYDLIFNMPIFTHGVLKKPYAYKAYAFVFKSAQLRLLEQLKVHSLNAIGLNDEELLVCACGGLCEYLKETQKHALANIKQVVIENSDEFMILDSNCMRNLEILSSTHNGKVYGSLLYVLDQTCTAMGARFMRNMVSAPLRNIERINYRLDGVEEICKNLVLNNSIREALSDIKDIERIAGKLSNDIITPRDMENLRVSLEVIPEIKFKLSGLSSKVLRDVNANIVDMSETAKLLKSAIKDNPPVSTKEGGFVREGFDEELDRLRNIRDNGKAYLDDMTLRERERTGIKNLKISYNKVFGYYIEITNSFKDKVPYDYIRKQTLTGSERYITEELKLFEEEILSANEKALKIENGIYAKLKEYLLERLSVLKQIARAISILDCICSLAFLAKKKNYCRPEIVESNRALDIVGGRHPVVESVSGQFVPNDSYLDNGDNSMMIITGPNMAGKSTYMRQVALITIMAHIGSFVPAKSAIIPITDRVFTRVGASDNLLFDQSTFMVEMSEVALILRTATKDSLIILDEVGRGTSTYDGLGIAWSVVEYLCKKVKAKTLFATHYHELSELEGVVDGVKNYKITVREIDGKIMFLRRIMRGSANKSFGIEVASLAGVPVEVTERAKVILKNLEKNDTAKKQVKIQSEEVIAEQNYNSEVERIILDVDVNNLTPVQALSLLVDLKEKIQK
ncbi:MAG: DNA mismatch repair protein MutS [Clostridia bacterium]|nr:DNA mismatch repair protein MutS [Clostridia bacterium]